MHNQDLKAAKRKVNGEKSDIEELDGWKDGADQNLISRVNRAVVHYAEIFIVYCKDFNVVMLLLRYNKLVGDLKEL